MEEIPLTGGNSAVSVIRIGARVHKPATPHSENVHALLQCLERTGVDGVPRSFGTDAKGRRIYSFLPGSVDVPPNLHSNPDILSVAARMLRKVHDASLPLVTSHPDGWALYSHPPEVICHNDFAPYNMVFDRGMPTGVFDFDLAGPGPRMRDLAYLAYWLSPLSFSGTDITPASEQQLALGNPRLQGLASAYGGVDMADLLDQVAIVLAHMADPDAAQRMIGRVAAERLAKGGHFKHWRAEHAAYLAKRPSIT